MAALVLALGYAVISAPAPPAAETDLPNWSAHVEPARAAYLDDHAKPLRWLDHGGVVRPGDAIHYAAADIDEPTAQAIRAAVTAGDPSRALAVFLAAQSLPGKVEASPIAASLKLQATLARPDTRFVRVYLFDSCINDGDVVDLYLDDELIAIVPLTNAGATLTLPVPASGRARIVLRGNVDGGGGITVGCRTSLGDFFCRPMTTGEVQPVGMIGD